MPQYLDILSLRVNVFYSTDPTRSTPLDQVFAAYVIDRFLEQVSYNTGQNKCVSNVVTLHQFYIFKTTELGLA